MARAITAGHALEADKPICQNVLDRIRAEAGRSGPGYSVVVEQAVQKRGAVIARQLTPGP